MTVCIILEQLILLTNWGDTVEVKLLYSAEKGKQTFGKQTLGLIKWKWANFKMKNDHADQTPLFLTKATQTISGIKVSMYLCFATHK